jgi:hypothetical protein
LECTSEELIELIKKDILFAIFGARDEKDINFANKGKTSHHELQD